MRRLKNLFLTLAAVVVLTVSMSATAHAAIEATASYTPATGSGGTAISSGTFEECWLEAMKYGGTIKVLSFTGTGEFDYDKTTGFKYGAGYGWKVPAGIDITLNMNSKTFDLAASSSTTSQIKRFFWVEGSLTITGNGTFKNGNVTGSRQGGGAFYVADGGSLTWTNGTIDSCYASDNVYGEGGAIYVAGGGTLTMNGGTIKNCGADHGGAIYVDTDGTLVISGGTINANAGYRGGGGITNCGDFTLSGGTISSNTATLGDGGGIYNSGAVIMTAGTITKNKAGPDTNTDGGGVYQNGGTFEMSGGTISSNAAGEGGGVWTNDGFTISGSAKIQSNQAIDTNGGGASGRGGGIYLAGREMNLFGGTISSNSAASTGGGIFVSDDDVVIYVKGAPKVSSNTDMASGTSAKSNVESYEYSYPPTYNIVDSVTTGMSIGISVLEYFETNPISNSYHYAYKFTEDWSINSGLALGTVGSYFVPDEGYKIQTTSSNELELVCPIYTITFDPVGGTLGGCVSSSKNTLQTEDHLGGLGKIWTGTSVKPSASKSGYSFLGFFTSKTGGTQPVLGGASGNFTNPELTVFTKDTTLYAQYEVLPEYKVTFYANSGLLSTGGSSTTITCYGYLSSWPTATKDGFQFDGWYTASTGGTKYTSSYFSENTTLYAHWSVMTYNITYDYAGGTATNPETYTSTSNIYLVNPTRPGYTFTGWSGTDLTGETNMSVRIASGSSGDRSYVAHWAPRTDMTYKIEHYYQSVDGATYELSKTSTAKGTTGTTVTGEYVTVTGFVPNATHVDAIASGTIPESETLTLKLYYDRELYTVVVDPRNGDPSSSQSVRYGGSATMPEGITRQGYILDGWLDQDGRPFFFTSTITKDMTVTANWTGATDTKYYVEHYQQSIDGTSYVLVDKQEFTGKTDTTVTGRPNNYDGFTADLNYGNVVSMGIIQADGSLTLRFYYDRKVMDVSMDPDNGDPIIHTSCLYEQTVTAPEDPEKPGYTFEGWTETTSVISAGFDDMNALSIANMPALASEPEPAAVLMFNFATPVRESLDLIAVYATNDYTVTIDPKNGDEVITQTVSFNTCATEPDPKPTKPGYHFDSWRLPDGSEFTFDTPITDDITIEARILPNNDTPYRVEHYQQNIDKTGYDLVKVDNLQGTTDTITKVTVNSSLFAGFTENPDHPDRKIMGTVTADGSLVLKLFYDRGGVTVTFDPDNGNTATTQGVVVGATVTKPADPTKPGYVFAGWMLDGVLFDFTTPITESIRLVASWTVGSGTAYKVEHYYQNVKGTGYDLGGIDNLTGVTGATATAVSKPGTGFVENLSHTGRVASGVISADGSLVLKLYYDRAPQGVTIDCNNGSSASSITVLYGDKVEKPVDPVKTGYVFSRWVDQDGNEFDFDMPVTDGISICAEWVPATDTKYVVRHYRQSVSGAGYDLYLTDELEGTTDSTVTAEPGTFTGFSTDDANISAVVTGTVAPDGTLVLSVYYKRNPMTITLEYNNGTTATTTTVLYEQSFTKPADPVRPGYDFLGWALETQTVDASGFTAYDFTTPVVANIKLVAQWAPSGSISYQVRHYQQNAARTGYDLFETETFTGTTGETVTGTAKSYPNFVENTTHTNRVVSGVISPDGPLVLAFYYDRYYTLTIDPDNGESVSVQNVKPGSAPTMPSSPSKSGYRFMGWFIEGGAEFDFSKPMTSDVKIKAGWAPLSDIVYTVERYRQKLDMTGYELFETKTHSGTVGQTVNATVEVYDGFTYDSDNPNQIASGVVTADGSLVLRLYYDRNTVTVTFDKSDGSAATTQNVLYGAVVAKPSDPVREGYVFAGWKLNGVDYDFSQPVTGNITLTAAWTTGGADYTIQHYKQDKSGYTMFESETVRGNVGDTVTATAKSYAGFVENTTHADRIASGVVTADGKLVLKLYYEHEPIKMDVDADNGATVVTLAVDWGEKPEKPADPVKPGYAFVHWVGPDGKVFDFDRPLYESVAIMAVWRVSDAIQYTVQHYRQDVVGNGYTLYETETFAAQTGGTVAAVPKSWDGFMLNDKHEKHVATGVITPGGDLVLSLYYDRAEITVTIDPDNGSSVQTQTIRYGGTVNQPNNPMKDGFVFVNWVDAKGNVFDFSKPVYANTMLKPTWVAEQPTNEIPDTGLVSTAGMWLLVSLICTCIGLCTGAYLIYDVKRKIRE